jgi:tetratricopeptide (TPR) repeat protein
VIVREMALVELSAKRLDEAELRSRRAVQLDPRDAENHAALGAVLEARGRLREAATVYDRAAAIDSAWRAKADAARAAADKTGMPDELREIGSATTVSRGELAGLGSGSPR